VREERGKIEGNLTVSDALTVQGMVTGSITVQQGGSLELHGMCCGNLTVEPGANASTFGMVCGKVLNLGGQLAINGMVTSAMTCQAGETTLGPDSRVMGGIEGKVVLVCKGCSQRLSVPGEHQELQVTCPKCRTSWKWTPAGTGGGVSHDQEVVSAVFRSIDFASLFAAVEKRAEGAASATGQPAVPAKVEPTGTKQARRGSRPWWRFW
jgi:cytoskeletal protein CcmA (bactofilin family)